MSDISPVIIINSLAAVGGTSISKKLAQTLDLKFVYAGLIFRKLCIEKGYCKSSLDSPNFEKEYVNFLKDVVEKDSQIDIKIDNYLLDLVRKAKVPTLIDSKVLAWLIKRENINIILSIYIVADIKDRVKRYRLKNNGAKQMTDEEISNLLTLRDKKDRDRYLKLYNIDLFKPDGFYDLIIDSTGQYADQTYSNIITHPVFTKKIKRLFDFYPDYASEWRSWKCLKCGYVYEGTKKILLCPKCGNMDPDMFQDL